MYITSTCTVYYVSIVYSICYSIFVSLTLLLILCYKGILDSVLEEYDQFDDYLEMVMQFGVSTILTAKV